MSPSAPDPCSLPPPGTTSSRATPCIRPRACPTCSPLQRRTSRTIRRSSPTVRSPSTCRPPARRFPIAVPTWANASGYASASGTSFSSPLVAGAAAWVWTRRPDLEVTQLFDLMRWSATDIGPKGFDEDTGFGLLNVPAALSEPVPPVDPHEPNDDISEITAGKLFRQSAAPLTSPGHERLSFGARLDVTEDPEDVYRGWVPAHRRVACRVVPSGDYR